MKLYGASFVTSLLLMADAGGAWAADPMLQPPVAVSQYDWNGLYIGVQGGYGWARLEEAGATDLFENRESIGLDGGFLGAHVGYNFQWDRLVLGVEADINKAWMHEDFIWGLDETGSAEIDWFGSLRARLGYARDRTMLFATAGVATAEVAMDLPVGAGRDDERFTGWTVGTGVEHAIRPNWLARAEYRYYDLGEGAFFDGVDEDDFDLNMHTVSVGLTYKF